MGLAQCVAREGLGDVIGEAGPAMALGALPLSSFSTSVCEGVAGDSVAPSVHVGAAGL